MRKSDLQIEIEAMHHRVFVASIYVERDENQPIANIMPHYTDERFKEARTVYLAHDSRLKDGYVEGAAEYNYSDRLWGWDWNKADKSAQATRASELPLYSAKWYEAFLSAYFDKPVKLVHILAGFNLATGYPYQVFGYVIKGE